MHLHYLHNCSESNELVAEHIETLLPEAGGIFRYVGMVILHGIGLVLDGIGWSVRVVLFEEAADTEIVEKSGCHDGGNVFLFHPVEPAVFDGIGNFDGNVEDDHD